MCASADASAELKGALHARIGACSGIARADCTCFKKFLLGLVWLPPSHQPPMPKCVICVKGQRYVLLLAGPQPNESAKTFERPGAPLACLRALPKLTSSSLTYNGTCCAPFTLPCSTE